MRVCGDTSILPSSGRLGRVFGGGGDWLTIANMNNLFHLNLNPRLRRPNGTREDPPPSHPSRGGNPYSNDLQRIVLQMHFNGTNLCGGHEQW